MEFTPRKNNPKETYERILNVSAQLFSEKGFTKTTMQDIIDRSGLSKGAIFYHFKSKEDIYHAVTQKMDESAIKRVYSWLAEVEHLPVKERIEQLLFRSLTDAENTAVVEQIARVSIYDTHLALVDMQNNVKKSAPLLAELIKEGITDGSITTEYPDEAAELLVLLINYWCEPYIFQPSELSAVYKRYKVLQLIMRQLGLDVITDEIIEVAYEFTEKLYNKIVTEKLFNGESNHD